MPRAHENPGRFQRIFIAEIIGEESLIGQRMSAGKLLHMMDIAAGSAGARHSESPLVNPLLLIVLR